MPARLAHDRRGFTLIEILAVVLIIGLTFGFFLPNLDATRFRRLEERAREVATRAQVAREQAIVTGTAHRLWLDLESGAMRVEWFVDEERAARAYGEEEGTAEPAPVEQEPLPPGGRRLVSLDPPEAGERDYYPVASRFGETSRLPEDYRFVGVETPDGFVEHGEVQLVFDRAGTTDYAEIVLADGHQNEVVLELQPLQSAVRIHRVEPGR